MGMGTTRTRSEAYEKYSDDLVRFATGLAGPTDGPDVVSTAMVHVLWTSNWMRSRTNAPTCVAPFSMMHGATAGPQCAGVLRRCEVRVPGASIR